MHQGVIFAAKMGSSKVIFESDALTLIQAVNFNENGEFSVTFYRILDLQLLSSTGAPSST